jgi:broad specificity phosphatase PhoE
MELYLIRHAQSLNNERPEQDRVEDPPLTDIGHRQCSCLATWIPSLKLTRVVTSPFLRALQTADHIGRSVRLAPEVRIDLHEQGGCVSGPTRDVFAGRPGMTRSQIRSTFPEFSIAPDIDVDGWWRSKPFETEDVARARAARLLAQTIEEFAATQERVAYVMHGDFKRLFLAQLYGEPLQTPVNTSVTRILIRPDGCRLEDYNQMDHLPADLVTS